MKAYILSLALLTFSLGSWGHAETHGLAATIDGDQEVPPSGSLATGSASITYDDVSGELSWDISWSVLSGPATSMHFHGPAPAGVNAGVQVNIGVISGVTSPSIGSTFIDAGQGADLLAELWYINIHTAQFPGGEIRGQVLADPVPTESSSWGRIKDHYRE